MQNTIQNTIIQKYKIYISYEFHLANACLTESARAFFFPLFIAYLKAFKLKILRSSVEQELTP